jgi:hypothetical protein
MTAAERAITRNRADFLVGGFRSEAVLAKGTARGFDLLDELAHEDNGETA